MKQPMILVTAGYQIAKNGTRQRYLYQNYADGIRGAGGFPLLPLDGGDFAAESARMCDGLLMTDRISSAARPSRRIMILWARASSTSAG